MGNWDVMLTQETGEGERGGLRMTVPLKENVEDNAIVVDGPSQPMDGAAYVYVHVPARVFQRPDSSA